MLQVYSTNIDFTANTPIPLNNVIISKGEAERLTAPATVELNKRGVYLVKVNGFGTGAAAGTGLVQLYRNGVAIPEAQSQFTLAADDIANFEFNTLVQVQQNNCNCNCLTSPVILQIMNGEEEMTEGYINVLITKIC